MTDVTPEPAPEQVRVAPQAAEKAAEMAAELRLPPPEALPPVETRGNGDSHG